jgi:segregation and condensation protein B
MTSDLTDSPARDADQPPGPDAGGSGAAGTEGRSLPPALIDRPDPGQAPGQEADVPAASPPLPALLEALLLVTDEPVTVLALAEVTGSDPIVVEQTLLELASDYQEQGRGFELRSVSGGWRMYTRSDCAAHVERFLLDGQSARLTQAALETLAVIAYRQPVTRGRVSAVRGVNVDGVVRTLQARGLICEAGQDADSAGTLFRTTPLFLERLGLASLDDLPALAPLLPELNELEEASTST